MEPRVAAPAERDFSAERAWRHLEKLTDMGPRVAGSDGGRRARKYLRRQLARIGADVREQGSRLELADSGQRVEAVHLTGVLPGDSPDVLMLAAHYDTAQRAEFEFLGTNDGASGPALLLELGRVLASRPRPYTIWLTFVDGDALTEGGEQAASQYLGSRDLADRLAQADELSRIRLAVFFNQVCDADLRIVQDLRSHPIHRQVFWDSAFDLGRADAFPREPLESPSSGHLRFLEAGLRPVVAIVDDRFGGAAPPGVHWHTERDTPEHCAPQSLETVGLVAHQAVTRIAARLGSIDRIAATPQGGAPPARSSELGDADSPRSSPPGAPEIP